MLDKDKVLPHPGSFLTLSSFTVVFHNIHRTPDAAAKPRCLSVKSVEEEENGADTDH